MWEEVLLGGSAIQLFDDRNGKKQKVSQKTVSRQTGLLKKKKINKNTAVFCTGNALISIQEEELYFITEELKLYPGQI